MTKTTYSIHNFLLAPYRINCKMTNEFRGSLEPGDTEYLEILHCFMNGYCFKNIIMFEDINGHLTYNSKVVAVLIDVLNRLKENETVMSLDTIIPKMFPFATIEDFNLSCIIIKPSQRQKFDLQYFSKY